MSMNMVDDWRLYAAVSALVDSSHPPLSSQQIDSSETETLKLQCRLYRNLNKGLSHAPAMSNDVRFSVFQRTNVS